MPILDSPDLYTIGWIAALPIERAAATALLDDRHGTPEGFEQHQADTNSYTWGRIGEHNIVIASLPAGVYGLTSAATTASNLLSSLPQIRIGLLVGIGGGIARPDQGRDIRLGDVVVGQPDGRAGGVIQYDLGKAKTNQTWERKGSLDKPPSVLLGALANLQAEYESAECRIPALLQAMREANPKMKDKAPGFVHQGPENDRLFKSTHEHAGGSTCAQCDPSGEVERDQRNTTDPEIHYGIIASGNTLVKDAATRDQIAESTGEECLCFEMEAAGLMNHFPCLVIRGICDYADSHKNDRWQRYASATAAAYAKELLRFVPTRHLQATRRAVDVIVSLGKDLKNEVQGLRTTTQMAVLSRLPIAAGASFDSYSEKENATCLPNTRVELLDEIIQWVSDIDRKCIYWLQGMAGTGKSTISRTVAQSLADKRALGASFFFKRGEGDRSKAARFFTSLAVQLVHKHPHVAQHVQNAIEADHSIADKDMKEQFEKLILQPLKEVRRDPKITKMIVVVIDALDECDREVDIREIIHLLAKCPASVGLRFFLTSRPELPIRLGFQSIHGKYQDLILHEIPESSIAHDISAFLELQLEQIRLDYNNAVTPDGRLPSDWPDHTKVRKLVKMAIPLFIFAATACRFISDSRLAPPNEQLTKILEYQTEEMSKLDATYSPVLDQLLVGLNGPAKSTIVREFRDIVGSIIILATPLSTVGLSCLLGINKMVIDNRLLRLHSVLDIPSDANAPVKLFHLSFRDFLLGDECKTYQFLVDERASHEKLVTRCLDLLMKDDSLKKDICGLQMPGRLREDIDRRKIDSCLPSEVQYACLYWVYHLKGSRVRLYDGHQALQFLQHHFLHWLEALSLIGRISESIGLIDELQSLVHLENGSEVSRFLHDAKRFILNCRPAIDQAPLQLYSSALVFAPERSIIRETFQQHISWITTKPIMGHNWNPCLQTLEGHGDSVRSVAFSGDGGRLASGSDDGTVKIWDAATGTLQRTLEGHSGLVVSVAFSGDGRRLASGSTDTTVKIWDAATGALQRTLEGYGNSLTSVAFSSDGRQLASGSADSTVKIWDAATGALQLTLEGHRNSVTSVTFSSNGRRLASGSVDTTVKIWDAMMGSLQQTLKGHGREVSSVAFSPDLKLIASGSRDETVKIWNAVTGAPQQTLKRCGDSVLSVAFSPNSKLIALGLGSGGAFGGKEIKIWDIAMGAFQRTLEGHGTSVTSVAFSIDGRRLISGSNDKTAKIWDAETGSLQRTLEGHRHRVLSVIVSPDSKLIASGSYGETVKVWDAATGSLQQTLRGHSSIIWSIAFSPDSKLIVSGSADETVKVWDVATGSVQRTLEGHGHRVLSVIISPDSNLIASGFFGKTAKVWDTATGSLQQIFKGHSGHVWSVAFSPDSKLIATGSDDATVKIWDVATGSLQQTLEGHGRVWSVAFSPDLKLVASMTVSEPKSIISGEKIMRIQDVATGSLLQTFKAGTSLHDISFDATGSYILTGFGSIRLNPMQLSTGRQAQAEVQAEDRTRCSAAAQLQPAQAADNPQFHGCGLSLDRSWISWDGHNVLWLPPDYRPFASAISPPTTTIALGCSSGRVLAIGFPARGPPNGHRNQLQE